MDGASEDTRCDNWAISGRDYALYDPFAVPMEQEVDLSRLYSENYVSSG